MESVTNTIKQAFAVVGLKASRQGITLLSEADRFHLGYAKNLRLCEWEPHPLYSVFSHYDPDFYLSQKEKFLDKYRAFWAVSKTISPTRIIELGACAASGADAYLSASPRAHYIGIDTFGHGTHRKTGELWKPLEIAERLLSERGFSYELVQQDLRKIDCLPEADLVVIDAAHDYENAYADLRLALTAKPGFIFVDDYHNAEVQCAVESFLLECEPLFTLPLDYHTGGQIIKLL